MELDVAALASFAGGFALCWFFKDKLTSWVSGTEALAKSLEARAATIRAALK